MDKPAVLIIDDEPAYLESISLSLEGYFLVRTAKSGLDALKIMNDANRLSLILLDLDMPEMTGVELLETVRSKNINIPILIVTGKGRHEWARRCAELGVQGYLDKLIDIEELIGKMEQLLIRR